MNSQSTLTLLVVFFCSNIEGFMHKLCHTYKPSEWKLLIDSSTSGLKAVLLHNGNQKLSIPIALGPHIRKLIRDHIITENWIHLKEKHGCLLLQLRKDL